MIKIPKKIKFWKATFWYPNLLSYATLDEWNDWHKDEQSKSPLKYWVVFDLQRIITHYYNKLISKPKEWLYYRLIKPYHIVKLQGLKPGYYDIDTRLEYAAFSLLKEYVEIEQANMYNFNSKNKNKNKSNAEKGIARLEWEASLDDPSSPDYSPNQASNAKELLTLYKYWINKINSNNDGYSISYELSRKLNTKPSVYYKLDHLNEKLIEDEETEMLIRLIKVRKSLWT